MKSVAASANGVFLGVLCKRIHDYQGTGLSLRRSSKRDCVECHRECERSRNNRGILAAQRELLPGKWYSQSDVDRFWAKVTRSDTCWEMAGWAILDYPYIWVNGKDRRGSRFSWELHHGIHPPDDMVVMHLCDNPRCVRPDHLRLGSQADNIADRDAKGHTATGNRNGTRTRPDTVPRGSNHRNAILNEEMVHEIRCCFLRGEQQTAIARRLGVSKRAVWCVVRRGSWEHVPWPTASS